MYRVLMNEIQVSLDATSSKCMPPPLPYHYSIWFGLTLICDLWPW